MLRVPTDARLVDTRRCPRILLALTLVVAQLVLGLGAVPSTSAAPVSHTIDLRVLLIDDDSAWVDALQGQMTVEGIPFTAIPMRSETRPVVTAAFLSSGDHAFFQAVILPSYLGGGLSSDELAAVRAFEAKFGVREVDAFNYANPAVGLNVASVAGDIAGTTATVTAAGKSDGFQYLNGPVPYGPGSYSYLATPLSATSEPPMPPGATFTTMLSAPIPNSNTPGSLMGVYASGGVEQMIITSAMNFFQPHFKTVAHGILGWATRGVHLGYNRNRMTFHVDDAFSAVALWDPEHNCTPGEDCPRHPDGTSVYPESSIRLTPEDITYAEQWQAANNYTLTLAYNGFYAAPDDPLTQSLVAKKASFRWLNHGLEHLYQGCVQDFSVIPWRCATDGSGNIVWMSQEQIFNEINANIAVANTYGLPINPTEYLSGEHSGLFKTPQQLTDNPNFVAAVSQAGLTTIGADASREPAPRQVGTAMTAPRHPTILYYNAATVAQEVDEFNWLYSTRANGGSGYCEDNPAVATCVAPLDEAGFMSTIIPNDAAFNFGFILSNDPRPFYAHTSNMGGDRIIYPLIGSILNMYRAAFAPSAPLENLTLTEVSETFAQQSAWAASGMSDAPSATASITSGTITIRNSGTAPVPLTAPTGTSVSGATLEAYGGEVSGWVPAAPSTTGVVPGAPVLTLGSPNFAVGQPGALTISAAGQPAPNISVSGALPPGLTFTGGTGGASITGTPTTAGDYPISVTAVNGAGRDTVAVTLRVGTLPTFTSAASAGVLVGSALNFTVAASGSPTPTLTIAGALPSGVTFRANANGTATLSGTPTVAGTTSLTFTATNSAGSTTQAFTLTVHAPLKFTSPASSTATVGTAFSFRVTTSGTPVPTITKTGSLPAGVTFIANSDGTATISGTPAAGWNGNYFLTITARNSFGSAQQSYVLTVGQGLAITSANTKTFSVGTASSFTVRATGTPTPTLSLSGTLPAGIAFTNNGNGTATLAGNAAPGTGGTYPLTIRATNTQGTVTQAFTLTVRQAPAFTSPSSFTGARSATLNFIITTTGFPVPKLSKSGALPSGLTFTAGSDGTARITGRTTTAGTFVLNVTATNAQGTATQAVTVRIT